MFVIELGEHKRRFFADIFITLIDLAWPFLIAIFFTIYLLIFMAFATFWWLMAYNNGDFDNQNNPDHEFCLLGVKSFPGAIMFSIETQTTIGYGFSYPNAHCAATVPLMYLQVVTGLFLETLMLGCICWKIARPKHRTKTILFSKQAVVCQENGKLVLQVRVGDLRKSHLVDSFITGMVIHSYRTKEGALYPLYQFDCQFTADGMADRMFLLFPLIMRHVINKDSPLYGISPTDLAAQKFEIVLYLTGTVESTGKVCQAQTSYNPSDILWGHRFERIEEFDKRHGQWRVNFKHFDNVAHCQDICHSARELDCLQEGKVGDTDNTPDEHTAPMLSLQYASIFASRTSGVSAIPSVDHTDHTESNV